VSEVVVDVRDGVATVTLNRPSKANALDAALVEALHQALDDLFVGDVHLLVLRGEGRNFCAGFDFSEFEAAPIAELSWRFVRIEQLLQKIAHAPCATAAFAHGGCYGAGADLVMACASRIADPGARFRMPGWRFGLALGTRRLRSRIGECMALSVLERAAVLEAHAAQACGMVEALCPVSDWDIRRDALSAAARLLARDARARLGAILVCDTRDADMASLIESLTAGNLKDRIRSFRAGA
jgi:enoyl-CoA hydratase/carnithine racemase